MCAAQSFDQSEKRCLNGRWVRRRPPRRGVIRLYGTGLIEIQKIPTPRRDDKRPWTVRVVACVKERFEGEGGVRTDR